MNIVSLIPKRFLLAALISFVSIANALADVNFTSWGGVYQTSQQKAYSDTWDKGTVNFLKYSGGLKEIRSQVETGNITWDIVDVLPHDARVGCDEDLFVKLDRSMFKPAADGTSMDDDLMVESPNDCVVPQIFWSYVSFYKAGTFKGMQPSTISDFFDLQAFPGKRGIRNRPNAIIEMALVADGVAIKDVYKVLSTEAGIDRAFAKLDDIRDEVVLWDHGEEPQQLVKSGEVAMSIAFNGRVGPAVLSDNEDFITVWDAQVLEESWVVLMNGAPNAEEAKKFLVHLSAPRQQAEQARYINYGPMRSSAFDIIRAGEPWFHNGKNIMEHMPNRPEVMSRTIIANPEWWADYGDSISEKYLAWIAENNL